jgi:CBS domain-containing protein
MPLEKRVCHFMHPLDSYGHITPDRSVRQALVEIHRRLERGMPSCLLVVEEDAAGNEVIAGLVTERELVFGIARHFLAGAERIGPIFWEGQLATESRQAMRHAIREIMSPVTVCVRDDEMVMEAIFLMNRYGLDMLPVVHQDEVVGIFHLEDIVGEVSRIAER